MFKKNRRWEDMLTREVIVTLWEKSLKGNRLEYVCVGNHQCVGRREIMCESCKSGEGGRAPSGSEDGGMNGEDTRRAEWQFKGEK